MSHWSFAATWPSVLIAALFLGLSGWLCYSNWLRSGKRKAIARLEALRFVLIAMLAFTLLRPEWVKVIRRDEKPEVVVLADRSRSMETRDLALSTNVTDIGTRAAWVSQQVTNDVLRDIEERSGAKVIVVPFSQRSTNSAPTAAENTDLNGALEQALHSHANLRAVLVMSDGDWNAGASPVSAATRYREQQTPIFSVAVGREVPLPDVNLASVSAPSYGLFGEQIAIPFTVRSHLDREVKTSVTLMNGERIETRKQITLAPGADLHETILFAPRAAGAANLTLQIPVEADEALPENNRAEFKIDVRLETLKVLVVDSAPRWEFRFLRNALARDPGVEMHSVLFHPGMPPGGGRGYLPGFPSNKDVLSRYDVIFLGDVGVGGEELTAQDAELIRGLVEQQSSGLVFLPGRRGRQASLLDSALKDLFPVTLDASKPEGIGLQNESVAILSTVGRRHLLTRFDADEARNDEIWKNLPGFFWSAPVAKSRPGSEVLAVHSALRNESGRIPVLVTRNAGRGKVLYLATDSAWRWRRGVEDKFHYRFWSQVVRWMAHQRHLSQKEGIRLTYSPEAPQKGDTVNLQAVVLDSAGFPIENGVVTAAITAPSGRSEQISFTAVDGGWGLFTANFNIQESGAHKITVASEKHGRRLQTELPVAETIVEKIGQPVNAQILQELAALTGGASVRTENFDSLVQQISVLPEAAPLERRVRLWSHPYWGGALLTLLAAYWIGRKAAGLI